MDTYVVWGMHVCQRAGYNTSIGRDGIKLAVGSQELHPYLAFARFLLFIFRWARKRRECAGGDISGRPRICRI